MMIYLIKYQIKMNLVIIKKATVSMHTALLAIMLIQYVSSNCYTISCNSCASNEEFICQTCYGGYTPIGGVCCINNCLTCTNQTNKGVCSACVSGYVYYYSTVGVCVSCSTLITNCAMCTSNTSCTNCTANYITNGTHCFTCSTTMPGCTACTSSFTCTACANTSITLSASANSCVTCSSVMPGCSTCSSYSTCLTCANTSLTLNASNSGCATCSQLMDGCVTCSSSISCSSCLNNSYALSNSSCKICEQVLVGCLYCSSAIACTTCINDTFALSSGVCDPCNAHLVYCLNCIGTTVCTNCEVSPNRLLDNQRCVECSSLMPNCLNCTSSTFCTVCSQYYVIDTAFQCSLCNTLMFGCIDCSSQTVCTKCSLGEIVIGGCSAVPGCIAVNQTALLPLCALCNASYFAEEPQNGTCICSKGKLAGKYCTEDIGCLNAILSGDVVVCNVCNLAKRFVLENGVCVCPAYFSRGNESCIQICGDGRLYDDYCDDGNTVNGDGCSSTCGFQAGYTCSNDEGFDHKSSCIYRGIVKLQYVCIYKTEDNLAEVILKTTPFISNILKSNLVIRFSSSKNSTLISSSFVGSNIALSIGFFQNIEGEDANVTIQFDPNYIRSPDSKVSITLKQCNGDRLYFQSNITKSLKQIIGWILEILSISVLIIWLVGSYSHKMIGVETLHTFQFILIPQAFSTHYHPVIIYFRKLCSILNIYQAKVTETTSPISSGPQSRLNYSADFLYSDGVVAFVQLIILLLLAISYFYQKKKKMRLQQQSSLKRYLSKSKKKFNFQSFLYNFVVFPIFIGFFLNLVLSLFTQSVRGYEKTLANSYLQKLVVIFAIASASFIYFSEWKQICIRKPSRSEKLIHKENYIPLYLTNFFLLCLIIECSLASLIPNPLYLLFGLSVFYALTIFVYRPYNSWVHNFTLFINNLTVIANICWLLSQYYIYLPRAKEEFIAVLLIICMVLILILAIVRIILELRSKKVLMKEKKRQEEKEIKKKKKKAQQFEMQMMREIEKQTAQKMNSYLLNSQLLRFKKFQEEQYEQRRKQSIQRQQSQMRRNRRKQKDLKKSLND